MKLADYTTLGLGGPARSFVTATTSEELVEAVRTGGDEPLLILGGGSNVVVADQGFPGLVIHVATRGFTVDGNRVTVAAGEGWDSVVERTVAAGLAGLECLSGIPGLAGATPIQNVGAYGQEVSDTIAGVRVFDREKDETLFLTNDMCDFSYRTSIFRGVPGGRPPGPAQWGNDRYVVLEVVFDLATRPGPVRYAELAASLGVEVGECAAGTAVRSSVLNLRRRKGMVIDPADPDTRSAGSFFTNPIVAAEVVPEGAPRFAAGEGRVKVPAAWLIEQAGFGKGYAGPDGVRISSKHTLALVTGAGATTASLISLAREIRDGVRDRFGVELRPEPVLVGVEL
ncbi:MAG: UDP-N-acetylmuramate dehydrogenase [Streptosporangiaceae bacterium]|nr:UDP-N-acetylmuramate dehydrogenase [Streptosporangiaceae bacterium]